MSTETNAHAACCAPNNNKTATATTKNVTGEQNALFFGQKLKNISLSLTAPHPFKLLRGDKGDIRRGIKNIMIINIKIRMLKYGERSIQSTCKIN